MLKSLIAIPLSVLISMITNYITRRVYSKIFEGKQVSFELLNIVSMVNFVGTMTITYLLMY